MHYPRHTSKADRPPSRNRDDLGYELHIALLISDVNGSPIAPVYQSLRSAEGLFQSSTDRVRLEFDDTKLNRLLPVFRFIGRRGWPKPPISSHVLSKIGGESGFGIQERIVAEFPQRL